MTAARPLLSIVGPTATGKTGLALWAAAQFDNGTEILSADSRQIYQHMSIATGADIPANFVAVDDHWQSSDGQIRLFGISKILPTESWSAYDFIRLAHGVIANSWSKNHLPILVGGTGLYHQLLWRPEHFQTDFHTLHGAHIRPDVREKAESLSVEELQNWAAKADQDHFDQLNHSDRSNPRRLVRLIEKALFEQEKKQSAGIENSLPSLAPPIRQLTIGLSAPIEFLEAAIAERVRQRIQSGAIPETERLIANFSELEWKSPAFSATGYRELRSYIEGIIDLPTATEQWVHREVRYAKRQFTWWKKYGAAEWFDVSKPKGLDQAQQKIADWIRTFTQEEK